MDATPQIVRVLRAMRVAKLEGILIGNAAAALHGAPVTTDDFDFLIRLTPLNQEKMVAVAKELGGTLRQPYEAVSDLYRIKNKDDLIQVDLLSRAPGIKSFESLRSRSTKVKFGRDELVVASLSDVIRSKKAAGRKKDLAVMPILEDTLREAKAAKK